MLGRIVGTVESRFVLRQRHGMQCMCVCGQGWGGGLGGKHGFYIWGGYIEGVVWLGWGWLEVGYGCFVMWFVEGSGMVVV